MDIPLLYSKTMRQLPFGIPEYRLDNPQYLDPRKAIIMRQSEQIFRKKKKGRFKPPKIRKPCFMDEFIKPIKDIPGPGAYKMQRTNSAPTKLKPKIDMKIKKNTYIDQIIFDDEKYKRPGVGKYNIAKSLEQQRQQSLKKSRRKISYGDKISNLDNVKTLASEVPGIGQYNLSLRRKFKPQMKDQDYYKKKNKVEEERARAKTARPDPMSYQPVPAMFQTFGSIERDSKSKTMISRWSHGTIDKRPTSSGFLVSPGPAQHGLINQWVKDPKNPKQHTNFKLLNRTSKGYKPGVYH